ncbi:MAG TPA: DUF5908 family protein [Gallionella sp.]|nr:DUF5908 family protein [Gallionella sp.]
MSIEIRQMVVKSNVVQRSTPDEETDIEENGNRAILEECKRLIQEALQEIKER